MKASGSNELTQILERACEALGRAPIERVWEAAQRCDFPVVVIDSARGTIEPKPFKRAFASADELAKGIAARNDAVGRTALALLADVDEQAAAEILGDLLQLDIKSLDPSSADAITRSISLVYQRLLGRIPPVAVAEAWLTGRVRMRDVPMEGIAAMPVRRIVDAYRANRSIDLDAERLVQSHPELHDGAAVLALLEDVFTTAPSLMGPLVRRLGELAYAPAVPQLNRVLLGNDRLLQMSAGKALLDIGTTEALASLARFLDALDDIDMGDARIPLAIEAAVRIEPRTSFDRLRGRFEAAALATPVGLRVARQVLLADAKLLKQDARWLDFAVGLFGDERLPARELLREYKAPALTEAMKRAGIDPSGRPPRTHPLPPSPDWLDRYKAGDYEAVWNEIRALEDSIRDPAVLPDARAVAAEIMTRVRANVERIITVLKGKKYKFRKAKPLQAAGPKTAAQLDEMEALLDGPLPLSVRAFHEIVGEVSLLEKPDGGDGPWFESFGRFEPLALAPLKDVLDGLKEDAKEEKAYPPPLRRRLDRLYLAEDPMFKEQPDESGNDRPVYLELLGSDADAEVELPRQNASSPRERVSFVDYLRRYILRGGFLWLPEDKDTQKQREALTKGLLPF